MRVSGDEICQVTEEACSLLLSMDVQRVGSIPAERQVEPFVHARVGLSGAWQGHIVLTCSAELSRRATAAMFALEPAQATDEEIRDALGELINVIGGGLKAHLPGPSALSLPTVSQVDDPLPATGSGGTQADIVFECDRELLVVSVIAEQHEAAAGEPATA